MWLSYCEQEFGAEIATRLVRPREVSGAILLYRPPLTPLAISCSDADPYRGGGHLVQVAETLTACACHRWGTAIRAICLDQGFGDISYQVWSRIQRNHPSIPPLPGETPRNGGHSRGPLPPAGPVAPQPDSRAHHKPGDRSGGAIPGGCAALGARTGASPEGQPAGSTSSCRSTF
jgi:hypothetical protein